MFEAFVDEFIKIALSDKELLSMSKADRKKHFVRKARRKALLGGLGGAALGAGAGRLIGNTRAGAIVGGLVGLQGGLLHSVRDAGKHTVRYTALRREQARQARGK